MPFIKDLLDAYDYIEKHGHPAISFPTIWHEEKASDVEIMIDEEGSLVHITKLERQVTVEDERGRKAKIRGDSDAITPITLYSECRTSSTAAPRPLSDKLKYFQKPVPGDDGRYYESLTKLLEDWNDFAGGNKVLEAILAYVSKGTITSDIYASGIFDDMTEKKKRETIDGCTVRFVVSGVTPEEPWENEELIRSWDRYMESVNTERVVDAVTGKEGIRIHKHGKNILPDNPNGKLFSVCSNENVMLHMVGSRFTDVSQIPPVTWDTSVKVHRMLRWLVRNRAVKIPGRNSTTYWMCFSKTEPINMDFDAFAEETGMVQPSETGSILRNAIEGKDVTVPDEEITVATVDYCTPGRIAVVFYESVSSTLFFEGLKQWRERYACDTSGGNKFYPSLYRIVMHAYGKYDKKKGKFYLNDAVRQRQMNRLLRCMLENRDIPADIVKSAVNNVENMSHEPEVMEDMITTAYALLKGGGVDMEITDVGQSRSFLYGRLLAIYEAAESGAIYKKNFKKPKDQRTVRQTNARKMWRSYVANPEKTEPLLYEQIYSAYMPKLSPASQRYYDDLIGEIRLLLDAAAKERRALSGEYLMGYTKQKNALRAHSREVKETLKNKESEGEEDE